ncbi:hypothetical protein CR513_13388, partial [Mucuna pruriens]
MCTDYTDLNKACPKDPYPLPSIDRLVDGASSFALLSFMDAYSRYNQIKMHPRDEAKMTFIMDVGAYYYKMMPFELKNAGATYQRLMDKIFEGLIGGDVEVYVDDMVVKSSIAVDDCRALGRVFQAGKFLGFMLTERGIEANLEKCQAIINMRSLWTVKEVQQLTRRITTLSRFLSRSAETIFPIFNTLKKGDSFVWMVESEEAFLRLKALLATPLILMKLMLGIPLLIYISVVEEAVSIVDAEQRYQRIEKAGLTLGHLVIVRMDLPIRKVLKKPDLVRQMMAWSVQLFEFDISYESIGHIKAQALVDFVTEMTAGSEEVEVNNGWFLSVDGASNQTGSGAEVILEGPNGVLIEPSVQFEFKARNNQAEYEALLVGMILVKELEAKILTAKSDSKLITGQVNREYHAKDSQLMKYLDRATKMAATFEKFMLHHMPREKNERANLLSKLATSQKRGV